MNAGTLNISGATAKLLLGGAASTTITNSGAGQTVLAGGGWIDASQTGMTLQNNSTIRGIGAIGGIRILN